MQSGKSFLKIPDWLCSVFKNWPLFWKMTNSKKILCNVGWNIYRINNKISEEMSKTYSWAKVHYSCYIILIKNMECGASHVLCCIIFQWHGSPQSRLNNYRENRIALHHFRESLSGTRHLDHYANLAEEIKSNELYLTLIQLARSTWKQISLFSMMVVCNLLITSAFLGTS